MSNRGDRECNLLSFESTRSAFSTSEFIVFVWVCGCVSYFYNPWFCCLTFAQLGMVGQRSRQMDGWIRVSA